MLRTVGDPGAEMVQDLDRWPLKRGCDAVGDLPQQHDACHGNVIGRDAAEPGQQLVGAYELAAVQPPGEGETSSWAASCSVGVRRSSGRPEHALFLLAWSHCPAGSAHPMPTVDLILFRHIRVTLSCRRGPASS
jgi:hypothetical protein